jgi:cytochrome c biogenesis protein CcmG, thiol:disulfide interchange protein DsbE
MKFRAASLALGLAFFAVGCTPMLSNSSPKLSEGSQLPDVQMIDLRGQRTSLSNFKGKVVFLNFWATWCGPCREEMPELVAAQNKYRAQGLVVLGLNVDESKDKIDAFLKTQLLNFDVWREDVSQQTTPLRPLLAQWQGRGSGYAIPYSVVVGRDGRVKATILGYDPSGVALEKAIQAALVSVP